MTMLQGATPTRVSCVFDLMEQGNALLGMRKQDLLWGELLRCGEVATNYHVRIKFLECQ